MPDLGLAMLRPELFEIDIDTLDSMAVEPCCRYRSCTLEWQASMVLEDAASHVCVDLVVVELAYGDG